MLCQFLQMYIDGDPEWKPLSCLTLDRPDGIDYIDYTGVLEKERLRAASPFTNMVRETSSSVCVIVAFCHMTHITSCHSYSIVLLLLYTVCWSTVCSTGRCEMGSTRVLRTPAIPCQIGYASGREI